MPRKSKEFLRRSKAAKLAYQRKVELQESLRRSKAAKKGWNTRRKLYGPSGRIPKPIIADTFPRNVQWLISLDYKNTKQKGFKADLLIIAPLDYTPTQLANQARFQLTGELEGKSFLANWIEGTYSSISQGELTNEPESTNIRSFIRYKK